MNVTTHPAESQEEVHSTWVLHTVSQFPVDQVLPGKHQQAQAHRHQQHVEDPGHVVDVQFTAHDLQAKQEKTRLRSTVARPSIDFI